MDKNQNLAVGALVAAAFLFRPQGSVSSLGDAPADNDKNGLATSTSLEGRAGPWIASCAYWAPVRTSESQPKPSSEVAGTIGNLKVDIHLDLAETKKQELGCGGNQSDRWGLPEEKSAMNVTAIVTTVPDPVHTHLALTFDRTIEAVLQSAADNGYVSSYYWLPWKTRGTSLKVGEALEIEPGHDSLRERQPGLIILKHVPTSSEPADSSISFYKVVYLFVVGETATQGIDGFQLQNAFRCESELKAALGDRFSTGTKDGIAIIGPMLSGSAASLRASINAAHITSRLNAHNVEIAGATYVTLPVRQLNSTGSVHITYHSFGYDSDYSIQRFLDHLSNSGYSQERVALLVEDDTAYASDIVDKQALKQQQNTRIRQPLTIRFPRDISLLRNAQGAGDQSIGTAPPAPISPYLHFTIRDYSGTQDSVPIFARENTPLSQEAQLMTIARQLHRFRTQFVVLSATNALDLIFLAQFLHRASPEATLVLSADLLTVREIDSIPFVGSIAITPYPLLGLGRSTGNIVRTNPNSSSSSYYNAASYIFWRSGLNKTAPQLEGYNNLLKPAAKQPPLWATVIGSDGYYPLGILSPCSSDPTQEAVLPAIVNGEPKKQSCIPDSTTIPNVSIYPARLWDLLAALAAILCLFHTAILYTADYWSPFSRDLAIADNDLPRRRSMFAHVAASLLFAMTWAVSLPPLWLAWKGGGTSSGIAFSVVTLLCGVVTIVSTVSSTRKYIGWQKPPQALPRSPSIRRAYMSVRDNLYSFLNVPLLIALIAFLFLWGYACSTGSFVHSSPDFTGLSFAYRCINPGSGVSPLAPVMFLLLAWYLWAVMQAKRLRFSVESRPRLPGSLKNPSDDRFFVSDDDLTQCQSRSDACLYSNLTCLMITRQMIGRFSWFRRANRAGSAVALQEAAAHPAQWNSGDNLRADILFLVIGGSGLVVLAVFAPMRAIDHFLWNTGAILPSPYELLVSSLFVTLIAACLIGLLRMILIWSALKRGVLDRLENMPIRFAFSRLRGMGWMAMLRQGGLQDQWTHMARSIESMRHMRHQPQVSVDYLDVQYHELVGNLTAFKSERSQVAKQTSARVSGFELVRKLEERFAVVSQFLLSHILIPYWQDRRTGLVESREPEISSNLSSAVPDRILAAEEFLAIRYISLITAVLANMRYLMTFVSLSFVLAVLAWNSYPFQPRKLFDWFFTGLLGILGAGVIGVFAQMHRNAILSRITDTKPNELGWDFYFRIVSFGALPVLTWLAYQFPDIGNLIYRFVEPVVPVIK